MLLYIHIMSFSPINFIETDTKIEESDSIPVPVSNCVNTSDSEMKTCKEIQTMFKNKFQYLPVDIQFNMNNSDRIFYYTLYLHQLIQLGNVLLVDEFCQLLEKNKEINIEEILNANYYETYCGNVLHTVLYFNTGLTARILYIYFRNAGAKPCVNYYDEYPWEQKGIYWTNMHPKKYYRNVQEFQETYDWINDYENDLLNKQKIINHTCYCNNHDDYDSE